MALARAGVRCDASSHEALKADAARWASLTFIGNLVTPADESGPREVLELRNCAACCSTLAIVATSTVPCHYCQGVEGFEVDRLGRCTACKGSAIHPADDAPHDDGDGWNGEGCAVCAGAAS